MPLQQRAQRMIEQTTISQLKSREPRHDTFESRKAQLNCAIPTDFDCFNVQTFRLKLEATSRARAYTHPAAHN